MKRIGILGASGSIGSQTIEVIRRHQDKFSLTSFSVYSNYQIIEPLLNEFKSVELVACRCESDVKDLVKNFPLVKFVYGSEGLNILATSNIDILVSALVGFVGLEPTLNAIKKGTTIALANKETLVASGEIVISEAKKHNAKIIPVDSEHSAIFQCLEENNKVKKVLLTCSGGPFFNKDVDLSKVTLSDALSHPNWKMGNKITIDSATLFNKCFEIIEAYYLFNVSEDQIEVLIHPQSIVHSLVEFIDGSIKGQLGLSDMKLPIAYALNYPTRLDNISNSLNLYEVGNLSFFKGDPNVYKPLALAYKALKVKGTYGAILNGANEEAVNQFINGKIRFDQIYELVNDTLNNVEIKKEVTLENIYEADALAREYVRRKIS